MLKPDYDSWGAYASFGDNTLYYENSGSFPESKEQDWKNIWRGRIIDERSYIEAYADLNFRFPLVQFKTKKTDRFLKAKITNADKNFDSRVLQYFFDTVKGFNFQNKKNYTYFEGVIEIKPEE